MKNKKVFITDYGFKNLDPERRIFEEAGYELVAGQCKTPEDVLSGGRDADALLVQWAPVPAAVISGLEKCRLIVRYGIGVDNVDLSVAKERQVAVCNVPDYCIDEVADHTLAMALALGRQLKETESRMRSGVWKITPPQALPPFREMVFATAGFGRIARAVMARAKVFGFQLISYDPFVTAETMAAMGVRKVSKEEALRTADVLSLHLPLNEQTRHFINKNSIFFLKNSVLLINTSRGGLIHTLDLADMLQSGTIGGAALDVFETEPLPPEHPLWHCPNTILTSHTAWYSQRSGEVLQQRAAEEVVRGLSGKPLLNRVA